MKTCQAQIIWLRIQSEAFWTAHRLSKISLTTSNMFDIYKFKVWMITSVLSQLDERLTTYPH